MDVITEADVKATLKNNPRPEVAELAKNVALVKEVTAVLNASLTIAEDFPITKAQLSMYIAEKTLAISNVAATANNSKGLTTANFAVGQTLKSLGLLKIAGMTPARASMMITLTMAEKVVSAAGMANFDKCRMAIAAMATTTGMAGFTCFGTGVFTGGISCMAGAVSIAAEAFNVYGQCNAK